jgi:hypothetical protein
MTDTAAPSATVEAPAAAEPAERPVDLAGGEVGIEEDRQKDDAKLNPLQRFAKAAQERKQARLNGPPAKAEKAAEAPPDGKAKPEKADAKPEAKDAAGEPERDANGRFLSKGGDEKKPATKPDEKAAAPKDKPKDAPPTKDEPPPLAAKDDKPAEAKTEPEPPKAEPATSAEKRRIAELLLEKKRWEAEKLEAKTSAGKRDSEVSEKLSRLEKLEAAIARARGNELDDDTLEQLTGRTFEKLVKDIAAGKDKGGAAYKPRPNLPPELQDLAKRLEDKAARFEAWEKSQADRERAAVEAKAKAEREAHEKQVHEADAQSCGKWLESKADQYPYLTGLPDAATQLRDTLYTLWPKDKNGRFIPSEEPSPEDVAEQIEQHLSEKLDKLFSSESAIKRALRDTKTRELVSRLLGTEQTRETNSPQRETKGNHQTAKAEGPPTLSSKVTQEAPVAAEAPDEFEDPEGYLKWWTANFAAQNRKRVAVRDSIQPRTRKGDE